MFPEAAVGDADRYRGTLNDEMRLFYVAVTRAQKYMRKQDEHTVVYDLRRSTSSMAVASCACDELPSADGQLVPAVEQLSAAMDSYWLWTNERFVRGRLAFCHKFGDLYRTEPNFLIAP